MEYAKCLICQKTCFTKNSFLCLRDEEILGTAEECSSLKDRLHVIFTFRKILEIPKEMCSKFLEDFGDPYSWMECCDSCSALLGKMERTFVKIKSLKEEYKKLQMQIKNEIYLSANIEENNLNEDHKGGVQEMARSYVCQAFGNANFPASQEVENENSLRSPKITNPLSFSTDTIDSHEVGKTKTNMDCEKNGSMEVDAINQIEKILVELRKVQAGKEQPSVVCDVNSLGKPESELRNESTVSVSGESFGKENLPTGISRTKNKFHECNLCGKLFTTFSRFKIHIDEEHTGNKSLKCNICGRSFTSKRSLTKHQRGHPGETPIKCDLCDICGKYFSKPSSLRNHYMTHRKGNPYKSEICKKPDKLSSNLKPQAIINSKEHPFKNFKCGPCGKFFSKLSNYNCHVTLFHQSVKRKLKDCPVCGKSVVERWLKQHMEIHYSSRVLYTCEFCKKKFTLSGSLNRHLRNIHSSKVLNK